MNPSSVTANVQRTLGISLGLSLSLGLGLLGLNAHSSSEASSSVEKAIGSVSPPTTQTDEGRSLHSASNSNTTIPPESFITYDAPAPPSHQGHRAMNGHPFASVSHQASDSSLGHTEKPAHLLSKQVPPQSPATSLTPREANTSVNEAIEQTVVQNIPGLASCPSEQAMGEQPGITDAMKTHQYVYHAVDLNGDRQDELIVQVLGPMTCGTGGCTTLILEASSDSPTPAYEIITQMSVAHFPFIVSDRTSDGWNDLLVMVSGGGTQPGYRQLKFNGQAYPTNPSMAELVHPDNTLPSGQILEVAEDIRAIAPVISPSDCPA